MNKISIFGAGRVGESTAQILAQQELCREVVLVDIRDGIARGVALDIQETAPLFGFDTRVTGCSDVSAISDSNLVVVTAGLPRKPGMSRSDLVDSNLSVIRGILEGLMRHAPQAMVLTVTNPVDVLTYAVWRESGWDRRRVFGLSGVLDAARMAHFIGLETGFSAKDITAMVLGGHGDAMVPLPRLSGVRGIPIERFMNEAAVGRVIERTRNGGAEILALKQTSSANVSPAAAVAAMVGAVAHNRRRILPCVAVLEGEYGLSDIAMGVPCVLSAAGVERVIELELNGEERAQFEHSAAQVRADMERL